MLQLFVLAAGARLPDLVARRAQRKSWAMTVGAALLALGDAPRNE